MMKNRILVFEENFNEGPLPNEEHWDYDIGGGGWGNKELQYYTRANLENIRIENGVLKITALEKEVDGHPITSTRLVSRGKKHWLYGRFEIKAKLPKGTGTWPAVWTLGIDEENVGWPAMGEIDIIEHVGRDQDTLHFSLHTGKYNHKTRTQITHVAKHEGVSESFHDYALDWDEEKISFEVDGIEQCRFYKKDYADSWPFDAPHYLILNVAIGGGFGGEADMSCLPATMEIESIRIYQ
jgi:beta-glucanase (GH16 family)